MFKSLLTAIAFLIASAYLSAQESKKVSIQFVTFPIIDKAEAIELLIGEGKSIPIELPTTNLSPVYEVPVLSHWALGKMEVTGEKEEKVFKEYGKADSTGTGTQLVLVLREGQNLANGLKLIPLNFNPNDFEGGEYFLMNFTKVDIGIELGNTPVGLKPGSYKLAKPKPSKIVNGHKQLFTKIHYQNHLTNKMTPFYSSIWRLNDKARCFVFFYHDPLSKNIRTHTIRSYL